jgi:hypothetical protein
MEGEILSLPLSDAVVGYGLAVVVLLCALGLVWVCWR